MSILAWLAGTKLGRIVVALGALALALLGAFAAGGWRRGQADKTAQARHDATALREVSKLETKARSASDGALAADLTRRP